MTRGHHLTSVCVPVSVPVNGDNNGTILTAFWKRLNECVCVHVCVLEEWLVENMTYVFVIIGDSGSHDNNNNN